MEPEELKQDHRGGGFFSHVSRIINEFEYFVSAVSLLGLVALLTLTIFSRYGMGVSMPWSEELARYMFVAVIFFSISYAARQHRHIRITMFVEKMFSGPARKWVFTIGDLVWLGFNMVVLYGAYEIMLDLIEYPYNSAVLNLPMYYVYAIIPISFTAISIRIMQGIYARHTGTDIDAIKGEAI